MPSSCFAASSAAAMVFFGDDRDRPSLASSPEGAT
jgi:hypothetical protein